MRRNVGICVYAEESFIRELVNKYGNKDNDLTIYSDSSMFDIGGFYADEPIYNELMEDIQRQDLKYSYSEYREYTETEIAQADYFHVNIPYPWEHDPEQDAEFYGTDYLYPNESSCGWCRQQTSELRINTKKMNKLNFARIIPELVVSEFTKNVIEEEGFTGCRFNAVRDYKGRETKPYFQLEITNVLPSISPTMRIEVADIPEHQCPKSPYIGFRRSEFIYDKQLFGEQMDFNFTFERFDAYQTRELIISSKVREAFNKHKIKANSYEPVRFI